MGTATMRFNEGVFVDGESVHGGANQLVVTGSISVMGTGTSVDLSANPTTTETLDTSNWYYIAGDGYAQNSTSTQPRVPLAAIPIAGGGSWSGEIYTFWGGAANDIHMLSSKTALSGDVTISFLMIAGGDVNSGGTTNDIKLADSPSATSNSSGTLGAANQHDFLGGANDAFHPVELMYSSGGFTYTDTWNIVSGASVNTFHGYYGSHPNVATKNINNAEFTRFTITVSGISGTYYLALRQYKPVDDNWNSWGIADLSITQDRGAYINFEGATWDQGSGGMGIRNNDGYMEYKDDGGSWKQFNSLAVGPTAPDRSIQYNNNGELGSGNFFYGTNANVGIGDFSNGDSDYLLHVKGNSGHTGNEGILAVSDRGDNPPQIILARENGNGGLIQSVSDGDSFGIVGFHGRNVGGTWSEGSRIEGIASVDSGNVGGGIKFQTKTPAGSLEDKMIIQDDGIITLPDGRNIIDSTNDNGGIVLNQKLQFRVNGTEVGAVSSDGIQADALYSKGTLGYVNVVGQNLPIGTSDSRSELITYSTYGFYPHSSQVTGNKSSMNSGASSATWDTVYTENVLNSVNSDLSVASDKSMSIVINERGLDQSWADEEGLSIVMKYANNIDVNGNVVSTIDKEIITFQAVDGGTLPSGRQNPQGILNLGGSWLFNALNTYATVQNEYSNTLGSGTSPETQTNRYLGGAYTTERQFDEQNYYVSRYDTGTGQSSHILGWSERLETQYTTNNGYPQITKRFGHQHYNGDFLETFRIGSGGVHIFGDGPTTSNFPNAKYGEPHLGFTPDNSATAASLMSISVYDSETVDKDITNGLNAYSLSNDYTETFRMQVRQQSGYDSSDNLNMGNSFSISLMKDNTVGLVEQFTITDAGKIGLGDSTPSATHKVSIGGDLFVDGAVDCQTMRFNSWQNESSSTPTGTLIKFDDSSNELQLNASHDFPIVMLTGTSGKEQMKIGNADEKIHMRGPVLIGNWTDHDVSGSITSGFLDGQGCVPSPGGLYAPTSLKHKDSTGWPLSASAWTNKPPPLYVENTLDYADCFTGVFVNVRNDSDTDGINIILGKAQNVHQDALPLTSPATTNRYLSFSSPTVNYDPTDNLVDTLGSNYFWNSYQSVGSISGDGSGGIQTNGISFTGTHDSCSTESIEPGMIVESTGNLWISIDMNTSLPWIQKSSEANSKTVFGVVSKQEILSGRASFVKSGQYPYTVNSLGEGKVWITNLVGSPTNGDYITSSPIGGYGQLQNDDILHSYTVAKLTEAIDWSSVTDTIVYEGATYKKYLAGCTYHCG